MTKDEVIRKNLDLHAEWMKYIFENPDVLDSPLLYSSLSNIKILHIAYFNFNRRVFPIPESLHSSK